MLKVLRIPELDIQNQIKETIEEVKAMKPEQVDAKMTIQTPNIDVDDEQVKKDFLKRFMEAGQDGSK